MGGGAEMCPHIYKVYSCERSELAVQKPSPNYTKMITYQSNNLLK